MLEFLMRFWCSRTHGDPMLPRHGRYTCRVWRVFECQFMGGGVRDELCVSATSHRAGRNIVIEDPSRQFIAETGCTLEEARAKW